MSGNIQETTNQHVGFIPSELLDSRERHALYLPDFLGSVAAHSSGGAPELVADQLDPYRVDMFPLELSLQMTQGIEAHKAARREAGEEVSDIVLVRINKGSPYGDIARFHETSIFKRAWSKKSTPEEYADESREEYKGGCDEASCFIALFDTSEKEENGTYPVIGIARAIDGSEGPLKTVRDMDTIWSYTREQVMKDMRKPACEWYEMSAQQRRERGRPEFTWDISSMAVDEDYRGDHEDAYAILSHELSVWALQEGVRTWTTIFVTSFYHLYTRFNGIPFRKICDARPEMHMDALSVPAVLHLYELPAMKSRPEKPRIALDGFRRLVQGEGLDYTALEV